MRKLKTKLCLDQLCEQKGTPLLLSAFPKNKRTRDGHHRYCRSCCVRRSRQQTIDRRARVAAKNQATEKASWLPGEKEELQHQDLVVLAQLHKERPQHHGELRKKCGLAEDEFGLALVELLVYKRLIKITPCLIGDRSYDLTPRGLQAAITV